MTRRACVPVTMVLILACTAPGVRAQSGFPESPALDSDAMQRPQILAGVAAGFTGTAALGAFHSVCDCAYESGSGAGFNAGISADYLLSSELSVNASLSMVRSFSTYVREDQASSFVQNGERVSVSLERRAEVAVLYLDARIAGRWYPFQRPFSVNAGVVLGTPLSDSFTDRQRIKTPGYVFYENNSSEVINADGALGDSFDVDAFRFALTAGVGYDWYLGGLWLTPEVSYEYPLLKVISESPGWKLQFLHASLRVGIAI